MKRILRLVIGCLLAASAGNAIALTPTEISSARGLGTAVDFYAVTDDIHAAVIENAFKFDTATVRLCEPGSLDIYYSLIVSDGYNQIGGTHVPRRSVLACRAGFSGTGITSGSTALIFHLALSSASDVNARRVARAEQVEFIDTSVGGNLDTACAAVTSTGATYPFGTGTVRTRDCGYTVGGSNSTVSSATVAPQGGISNVEPGLMVGGNLADDDVTLLTRHRSALAITYNPIVSVPLFTVLQRAYGYIGDTASDSSTSLDTLPSLPSAVLRGIFNGNSVLNADEVNLNGVKLSTKLATPTGSSITYDSSGEIYVCRRGDMLDVMASFKMHFLRQGCVKNPSAGISFVDPDQPVCSDGGCTFNPPNNEYVFAGTSRFDVQRCVDYHSLQGRLAVGVVSTTAKPLNVFDRFRYIKVDGAEPTLKAVMEGRYDFFTEDDFYDKFGSSSVTGTQTLWDRLHSVIGNGTSFDVISKTNSDWRNSASIASGATYSGEADTGLLRAFHQSLTPGWLSNPLSDATLTGFEVRNWPANTQTRTGLSASRFPTNCNLPHQAYP